MSKKAFIFWGGWEGHEPKKCAELFTSVLQSEGFQVENSNTLDSLLDREKLLSFDLIVPIWTMGTITKDPEKNLLHAVKEGVGLAGWHGGMGDAFRQNTEYQFMVGGQFVAHPDNMKDYTVQITKPDDPIVQGLQDFQIHSEQYYMHVDPSNEVLATTTFQTASAPWVNGCVMPVVWKRRWGKGKVFYSSIGHSAKEFEIPQIREIQRRGLLWAARS
jgi:uncharacterized protein